MTGQLNWKNLIDWICLRSVTNQVSDYYKCEFNSQSNGQHDGSLNQQRTLPVSTGYTVTSYIGAYQYKNQHFSLKSSSL